MFTTWNDGCTQSQSCWVDDYYISTTRRSPVYTTALTETQVILQDGLNDYTGCEDTVIKQGAATTNYVNTNGWSVYYNTGNMEKILIKFDLSSIPSDATITKVWLDTYCSAVYSSTHTVKINRILKPVNYSQCTWNIYSTGNNWDTAGCSAATDYDSDIIRETSLPQAYQWVTYFGNTLVDDVQKMVNGTYDNNGWIITPTSEPSAAYRSFASSENATVQYRPKLIVEYNLNARTKATMRPNSGSGKVNLGSGTGTERITMQ
jgi:hypothetical protein